MDLGSSSYSFSPVSVDTCFSQVSSQLLLDNLTFFQLHSRSSFSDLEKDLGKFLVLSYQLFSFSF